MASVQTYITWTHNAGDYYVVTGVDLNGKRFRMQYDTWLMANAINMYRGRVWHVDGQTKKRKLVKEVYN